MTSYITSRSAMILPVGSRNYKFACRLRIGRFCWDFRRSRSAGSVSSDMHRLSGRFWPPVSASKNSVARGGVAAASTVQHPGGILGVSGGQKRAVSSRAYRGFNPRASNCWLHSAGASRSRSTSIPRGKRPSTADRTRSGARNASEIVILT